MPRQGRQTDKAQGGEGVLTLCSSSPAGLFMCLCSVLELVVDFAIDSLTIKTMGHQDEEYRVSTTRQVEEKIKSSCSLAQRHMHMDMQDESCDEKPRKTRKNSNYEPSSQRTLASQTWYSWKYSRF